MATPRRTIEKTPTPATGLGSPLNSWEWNNSSLSWQPVTAPTTNLTAPVMNLRIMTYNVWFDAFRWRARYAAIFSMVDVYDPDIVCFQEVTKKFMGVLWSNEVVRRRYAISDGDCSTFSSYGVVTLVRRILSPRFFITPFATLMGRRLLTARFTLNEKTFVVGNVHLESLENRKTRIHQLGISFPVLQYDADVAFLMGDFNFGDGDPENGHIPTHYVDAWKRAVKSGVAGGGEGKAEVYPHSASAAAYGEQEKSRKVPGPAEWKAVHEDRPVTVEQPGFSMCLYSDNPSLFRLDHLIFAEVSAPSPSAADSETPSNDEEKEESQPTSQRIDVKWMRVVGRHQLPPLGDPPEIAADEVGRFIKACPPSDHFGLVAEFCLSLRSSSAPTSPEPYNSLRELQHDNDSTSKTRNRKIPRKSLCHIM